MKKKLIIYITLLLIITNICWCVYFYINQISWDMSYQASVDYATELGFALGYETRDNNGKWTEKAANSTRLKRIKIGKRFECWDLPTNPRYILEIDKENNGMIIYVNVLKKTNYNKYGWGNLCEE